ncbi:hypothetical protein M0811_01057 [Anaeramoeba ignava]|uniref:Uncharacterized protein n=1 Tax=Anaeramoeba ignava TaxID=1746090 RepID=A0A9Q0RBP2_ANAIG|nr:hypothetical protein M0811_01057 [Anaeramoeba ignava]
MWFGKKECYILLTRGKTKTDFLIQKLQNMMESKIIKQIQFSIFNTMIPDLFCNSIRNTEQKLEKYNISHGTEFLEIDQDLVPIQYLLVKRIVKNEKKRYSMILSSNYIYFFQEEEEKWPSLFRQYYSKKNQSKKPFTPTIKSLECFSLEYFEVEQSLQNHSIIKLLMNTGNQNEDLNNLININLQIDSFYERREFINHLKKIYRSTLQIDLSIKFF